MRVVLDYGHGVDTQGKEWEGFKEYAFNRAVGGFLEKELDKRKVDYHVLVTEDTDIGLRTRVERAKAVDHDLLVSIHGNWWKDEDTHGIETFYYSAKGKIAAEIFQKHLVKETEWKDRGVKKANYYIIKKTPEVAILTESGFYSNKFQRSLMSDPYWQREIAIAHANAIQEYFSL